LTQTSLLSKDIARQKEGRHKKFKTEIKSEESELRKLNEELQKQRVILSPAAFEQEVKNFRQREIGLQKKVQQRNQEFNRLRVFTNRVFIKELNRALADVTKKHNFTLILRKSGVLVNADVFDITSLVLAQINKNAPNFKIPDVLPKREK
jgi:outer membrane protein